MKHTLAILLVILFAVMPALADIEIPQQVIEVELDPATHNLEATTTARTTGTGQLIFETSARVEIIAVMVDDNETLFTQIDKRDVDPKWKRYAVNLNGKQETVQIFFKGVFEDDVAAGEVAGQIHNHAVQAHISEIGVFLSTNSGWHPRWLNEERQPMRINTTLDVALIEDWRFVASGNPVTPNDTDPDASRFDPPVQFQTPWPVTGMTLVGNKHTAHARVHATMHGNVEVVAHFSEANAELAPLFVDAACDYLDLYVPTLGPYPFSRFTIVENFFSSGFAFPGFTVLGPRVVTMGDGALKPGYLDHEFVHNWFGNGVMVKPGTADWSEGLTTYLTNYCRTIVEGGEKAGREFRRNIVMQLSSAPEMFDNGPVDRFGLDPRINRFVGYQKVAFIFMMLEHGPGMPGIETDRSELFMAIQRFAAKHMGQTATWDDLQQAIESQYNESRADFFDRWVRSHNVPQSPTEWKEGSMSVFASQLSGDEIIDIKPGRDADGNMTREIDPNFLIYRTLPRTQISPTLAGTFGKGGVHITSRTVRPEVNDYLQRMQRNNSDDGENLFLIGREAIEPYAELIKTTENPITIKSESFEVDGKTFDSPTASVLHTMPHPDLPGRSITVFHANGSAGWKRLRLVNFYTRDSTIVWDGDEVIHRATFEPSRAIPVVDE